MTNFDDLFNDLNEVPLFPELIMPLSPPNLCPVSEEISLLNSPLEHLSLDVHRQSLRVTIERAKRQKLGTIIRKIKRNIISPKMLRDQTQHDNNHLNRRLTNFQQDFSH